MASLKITQTKSANGRLSKHKACLKGLGLRRLGHSVLVADTAENRGMANKIAYMLDIQQA